MDLCLQTFLLLLVKISIADDRKKCSELEFSNGLAVNCSGLGLFHLPEVSRDAKILDLSWNELNSINSTKLENLKVQNLNLSHNKIQEIKLYNLVDLKVLDASHNEINNAEDVSIKNSTIEEINLSGNHIKSLKNLIFEQNRKLKVLDLSHNEISVISNLSSESIQILYLNNNHLHYIKRQSLIELVNLKKLILTDNKRLYTLNRSNKFLILEELKILDASHCGLTKLDVNGFPKLEILYLSYNNISKIASDSFKFSVLLVTIDLSFNSIDYFETDSFLKNENLKFLNLRGNKIIDLAWTVHLQTVGLLNLSHNCVTNILNLNLTKVKILDLSNNKIEKLMTDFDVALPNIVDFNLKSNRIKEIIRLKSRTLQILNLASCKIINVDENAFREVDTLEKLTLSDNKVKNLKFVKHLLHLKELNLDENAWECRCKDRDQTELFENENITLLDDVVCVPDGLTWLEFCEREEKAEIKKIQELNSLTLGDGVQKSSVEPGWVAGGVSILLIIITVSGWMFYRKRSRDKRLTKLFRKKKKKPTVDLLEATPPKELTYHYSYVHPPVELVELRTTCRESFEPKFIDLQEAEEIQSLSSHIYSFISESDCNGTKNIIANLRRGAGT